MSTSYYLAGVGFDFDALKTEGPKVGLHPCEAEQNGPDSQCYLYRDPEVTQVIGNPEGHYLWAYRGPDGRSVNFTRYGSNSAAVWGAEELAAHIGAELVSEHDERWMEDGSWGDQLPAAEVDGDEDLDALVASIEDGEDDFGGGPLHTEIATTIDI